MLVITDGNPQDFEDIVKKKGEKYLLFLGNGCPQLDNLKCKVHNHKNRPKTCNDYPIFLYDDKIVLSKRCFPVRDNILFPYLKQMKGMKIEYH